MSIFNHSTNGLELQLFSLAHETRVPFSLVVALYNFFYVHNTIEINQMH